MTDLFDPELRALRRDRAARTGVELFLYERTFADCLDRITMVRRAFRSALLIGCPDAGWPARLGSVAPEIAVADPGPMFAAASGGSLIIEDAMMPDQATRDLVLAVGTLDTVNDLPRALRSIRQAIAPGGLFLGAMSGGDTLPRLRAAMRAADTTKGEALPHVHPRIEPSQLAPLLSAAGFTMPVVDVDRISVAYRSFEELVRDLRAMGATNILRGRSRVPLSRPARTAAITAFAEPAGGKRTTEVFEILHFAAWAPPAGGRE